MSTLDDLLDSIFNGTNPALRAELATWIRESRRFRAFAASYQSKIRAKLKNAPGDEGLLDLRAELQTAAHLLREKRFTLEYETYAASKHRGPDFTVMFKTHTPFNVEVRRVRSVELDYDARARTGKLMAVLSDKAGQMPPSIVNLLWLTAERDIAPDDLTRAAAALLRLAESKTEDFFTRRGFESASSFLKQYSHLSGIVLHQPGENRVWLNGLARHKAPPAIVTALQRLEAG